MPQCLERYLIENPPGSPAAMNGKCQLVVEKWELIALQETTTFNNINNMIEIIHFIALRISDIRIRNFFCLKKLIVQQKENFLMQCQHCSGTT